MHCWLWRGFGRGPGVDRRGRAGRLRGRGGAVVAVRGGGRGDFRADKAALQLEINVLTDVFNVVVENCQLSRVSS